MPQWVCLLPVPQVWPIGVKARGWGGLTRDEAQLCQSLKDTEVVRKEHSACGEAESQGAGSCSILNNLLWGWRGLGPLAGLTGIVFLPGEPGELDRESLPDNV